MDYKKILKIVGFILFGIIPSCGLVIVISRYSGADATSSILDSILWGVFIGISTLSTYIVNKRYKNSPFLKTIELIVEVVIVVIFIIIIIKIIY